MRNPGNRCRWQTRSHSFQRPGKVPPHSLQAPSQVPIKRHGKTESVLPAGLPLLEHRHALLDVMADISLGYVENLSQILGVAGHIFEVDLLRFGNGSRFFRTKKCLNSARRKPAKLYRPEGPASSGVLTHGCLERGVQPCGSRSAPVSSTATAVDQRNGSSAILPMQQLDGLGAAVCLDCTGNA